MFFFVCFLNLDTNRRFCLGGSINFVQRVEKFFVYSSEVTSQVRHNIERSRTNRAAVRLLLTMDQHVLFQLALGRECFEAVLTPKRFHLKYWSRSFSGSVYYRIILMYKAQNENNNNDNNNIITEKPNFREN